jgi:hypothetical protein
MEVMANCFGIWQATDPPFFIGDRQGQIAAGVAACWFMGGE